jgi:hypothetical protein
MSASMNAERSDEGMTGTGDPSSGNNRDTMIHDAQRCCCIDLGNQFWMSVNVTAVGRR